MAIGEIDTRTTEEIMADLERRRKGYKFLTTEEALAWNKARGLRPLQDSHWMVKHAEDRKKLEAMIEEIHKSYEHRLKMAKLWKSLAKQYKSDLDNSDGDNIKIISTNQTGGINAAKVVIK